MESATGMQGLSFGKKLRQGQQRVLSAITPELAHLNIKLPTGYGKTFTAICAYSILQKMGRVNRLLYIVSNRSQLNQFCNDASGDLYDARVSRPHKIVDIDFSSEKANIYHRRDECQAFVTTVQSLTERRGMGLVRDLLETGQWMVVVDEYHHYGIDKPWARAVLSLNRAFLLAMSATPARPNDDSAFGTPLVSVTYREAVDEHAVKPLRGHAYHYRIDICEETGEIRSISMRDLFDAAGSDSPDKIEKFKIERRMRWSPDYISPLVSVPVERMLRERIITGHRLQVLIEAFCCSHANLVCEQIRDMFPDLNVEWVGTGESGRSDKDNERILKRFCPPKDETGRRPESDIDVLVQVGMAGEGVDCVYVSEVVHLNGAALCNKRAQTQGRAARYLQDVTGHINFDASSELAEKGYVGDQIMDAMDFEPPHPEKTDEGADEDQDNDEDWPDLPDEPEIRIFRMELEGIDSGDPGVQRMAGVLEDLFPQEFKYEALWDENGEPTRNSDLWDKVIKTYRGRLRLEAEENNEKSIIEQWKEHVKGAVKASTGNAIRQVIGKGKPYPKELAGTIKRLINQRKKRDLGAVCNDIQRLKQHYRWCLNLDRQLKQGLPSWLEHLSR